MGSGSCQSSASLPTDADPVVVTCTFHSKPFRAYPADTYSSSTDTVMLEPGDIQLDTVTKPPSVKLAAVTSTLDDGTMVAAGPVASAATKR